MVDRDVLNQLYVEDNMTMAEVGNAIGVSVDVIAYWLRKHGLPRRKRTTKKRVGISASHEWRVCPVCGNSFHRHRATLVEGSCCSVGCCDKKKKKSVSDSSIAKMYVSGMSSIEIGCKTGMSQGGVIKRLRACGVKIRGRGDHLLTDKNPTRGKGHTDETRRKLREITLRQFESPRARKAASHRQVAYLEKTERCVSSWEKRVAGELDHLGIKYETSKGIRDPRTGRFCACVDLFINGKALEVNGTYYHSDPRAYPDGPKTYTQRHNADRYAKKVKHLSELGIPLFEVWEIDLEKDVSMAVREVMIRMGELK